mmetsp:Transcript_45851/g.105761  ORF Transcript_45851/g.105761 Transcript_45851/m.105761 type:complete len:161 (-) Transcript_45851:198-680(-)
MAQHNLGLCHAGGEGLLQNFSEAARYYRLVADQGFPSSQFHLGEMLIRATPVDERVPTDPRAGAKLLSRVVQCEGAEHEPLRLKALELLRKHADQGEVVAACCIGCGAHHRRMTKCSKCHTARFCSSECIKRMWPTHKQSCQRWQAEQAATDSPSNYLNE